MTGLSLEIKNGKVKIGGELLDALLPYLHHAPECNRWMHVKKGENLPSCTCGLAEITGGRK
jgi:hypothetical protein